MSKYCNECNENIANGTMDCPSCGFDLRGKTVRYWINDPFESIKAMTYHELVDAMLNNHSVWFWRNDEPFTSLINSIDKKGVIHFVCETYQVDVGKLFATKLDLVKAHFDRIQKMLKDEEDTAKDLSFEDGLDD